SLALPPRAQAANPPPTANGMSASRRAAAAFLRLGSMATSFSSPWSTMDHGYPGGWGVKPSHPAEHRDTTWAGNTFTTSRRPHVGQWRGGSRGARHPPSHAAASRPPPGQNPLGGLCPPPPPPLRGGARLRRAGRRSAQRAAP